MIPPAEARRQRRARLWRWIERAEWACVGVVLAVAAMGLWEALG